MNLSSSLPMAKLAHVTRRDSIFCPGSQIATVDDPFLRKVIQLMIDGSEQEYVKEVPDSDINQA
ncbi:MAG: hypothetical protein QGG48_12275 [Desulfatiglandales bacterium]|nr:hypothetical protein [Desulfatiglandales bacterium]